MDGITVVAAATALLAAAAAGVAGAAIALAPDPARMTLQQGDIAGAKATGKSSKPEPGYTAGYTRDLALARPYGSSRIVYVESIIAVAPTSAVVATDVAQVRAALRTKSGRDAIVAALADSAGIAGNPKAVSNVVVRTPHVGDEAVELDASMMIKLNASMIKKVKVSFGFVFFGVDRVRSTLATVGLRPVVPAEVARLAKLVVGHIGSQLAPSAEVAPAIAGTALQGQTLVAQPGTWSNAPTLSYRWQRCDANGTACVDVAGAVASSYAVTAADAATTLRVVVTGTSRFGSTTAQSAQTAVVPAVTG